MKKVIVKRSLYINNEDWLYALTTMLNV